MDREVLGRMILAREPVLKEQLMRKFVNEYLVDEALGHSVGVLMTKPDLWKPEKGCFNTYYFNIAYNYCKSRKRLKRTFMDIDEPVSELNNTFDSGFMGQREDYQTWIVDTFPFCKDYFVVDPYLEPDPLAEEIAVAKVKKYAGVSNVFSLFSTSIEERTEEMKLDVKESYKLKLKTMRFLRDKIGVDSHVVNEWRLLMSK